MTALIFKTHLLEVLYWIKGLDVIGISLFKYMFREHTTATWTSKELHKDKHMLDFLPS